MSSMLNLFIGLVLIYSYLNLKTLIYYIPILSEQLFINTNNNITGITITSFDSY